jgi:hypothetical protein
VDLFADDVIENHGQNGSWSDSDFSF